MSDETLKEFYLEASELLDACETSLLSLDKGQDYQSHFNCIFRAFHSIKGGASMLEQKRLAKLVHFLEDILTEVDEQKKLVGPLIDFFLEGVDATRKCLNGEDYDFQMVSPLEVRPAVKKKHTPAPRQEKKCRVFHLDDEEDICELVGDYLEDRGFEVQSFTDGESFLERVAKEAVDILVVDFYMPGMTGLEILKQIKSINIDIPVIFLSGNLSKDVCIEAVARGAYAILEKPIDDELFSSVLCNAERLVRSTRLITKSINLLKYQFSDLDQFLKQAGKEHIRQTIATELKNLILERQELKENIFKDKTS